MRPRLRSPERNATRQLLERPLMTPRPQLQAGSLHDPEDRRLRQTRLVSDGAGALACAVQLNYMFAVSSLDATSTWHGAQAIGRGRDPNRGVGPEACKDYQE